MEPRAVVDQKIFAGRVADVRKACSTVYSKYSESPRSSDGARSFAHVFVCSRGRYQCSKSLREGSGEH
jgi:hypothetical protein